MDFILFIFYNDYLIALLYWSSSFTNRKENRKAATAENEVRTSEERERVILKGNFLIGEGRGMNNIECDLFVCLFVKVI